jgi:Zn-finger nucleic acid-binding protein
MSNREGIEIDYCPNCRGVWLDRGELDKIIERSAAEPVAPAPPIESHHRRPDYDDDYRQRDQRYHKGKRRGLLGDLFDFD